MLFASAEPIATRKPTATNVVGSVESSINAALEAMKMFEGPANGIRLSPNEVKRTSKSSMIDAIPRFLF